MKRRNFKNLTGCNFNSLEVIKESSNRTKSGTIIWECKCKCGNTAYVSTSNLILNRVKSCGCALIKDLSFQKFGRLSPLYYVKSTDNSRIKWVCKCDCGNEITVRSTNLHINGTKSCGKCRDLESRNKLWKGYYEISKTYFSTVFNGAIKRNLEFDITIKDMWDQYLKQNKKCSLTGRDIYFSSRRKTTASLDRIDSSKGYTKDNIQWVHKDLNIMKMDFTEEYFIQTCKEVVNEYERRTIKKA